ncbi:hypothetical protein N9L49_04995 [Rhodospirillales bacterium]|nr:hypothetical protein [Rhodospirillales bacterium]
MKLWKAISKSITNLLAVLDNFSEGTNELSIMYKEACYTARQEQAIESLSDLKKVEQDSGLSENDIVKLQAAR